MRPTLPYNKIIDYDYDLNLRPEEIRGIAVHFPIFLSSRISEFKKLRKKIANEFKQYGFTVMGWEVGEKFGSPRKEKPRQVYLNELGRCKIYCGIIGKEYGPKIATEGISATEDEYNLAIKEDLELCLFIQKVERKEAEINQLAEKWMAEHTVSFFKTMADLKKEIKSFVRNFVIQYGANWLMLGDTIFQSAYKINNSLLEISRVTTNINFVRHFDDMPIGKALNFIDSCSGENRQIKLIDKSFTKTASKIWECKLIFEVDPRFVGVPWNSWKQRQGISSKNIFKLVRNELILDDIVVMLLNVNKGELFMNPEVGSNLFTLCQKYYKEPQLLNILAKIDILETLTRSHSAPGGSIIRSLPCLESVTNIKMTNISSKGLDLVIELKMYEEEEIIPITVSISWKE